MQTMIPRIAPAIKYLLIVYSVMFILSVFIPAMTVSLALYFQADPASNISLIWRAFTYSFVGTTDNVFGFLLFALFLWWVGSSLEREMGTKTFLVFFAFTIACSGILSLLFLHAIGIYMPVMGTLGLTFAMVAVFAFRTPETAFYFFGLFPLKAKWLALISLVLTFLVPSVSYIIYALVIQVVTAIIAIIFVAIRFPLPYWLESVLSRFANNTKRAGSGYEDKRGKLKLWKKTGAEGSEGRSFDRITIDPSMSKHAKKEAKKIMDRIYKNVKKDDNNK
jgi:membrane associated rhomboid family serine protease